MPSIFGKDIKKKELIKNLSIIYQNLQREWQISLGDFPDIKKMQETLMHCDFSKFNSFKPRLVEVVDKMLVEDISKLMEMLSVEEAAPKPLIEGKLIFIKVIAFFNQCNIFIFSIISFASAKKKKNLIFLFFLSGVHTYVILHINYICRILNTILPM